MFNGDTTKDQGALTQMLGLLSFMTEKVEDDIHNSLENNQSTKNPQPSNDYNNINRACRYLRAN